MKEHVHRMCRLLTFVLLITSQYPHASASPALERFNPDGAFWIIGETPQTLSDFGGINLNSNRNKRLPAAGVDLRDGTHLKFKTITVARTGLTFTTIPFRGVSYSFKGKFLEGGTFAARDLQENPVLEGTLTKMKQGKVVGEAKLKFSYFGGT